MYSSMTSSVFKALDFINKAMQLLQRVEVCLFTLRVFVEKIRMDLLQKGVDVLS